MGRHVVVAVPAYTGTVHLGTMRSILRDAFTLMARGDRFTLLDERGNAVIADARAFCVADFLATDGTDLVFVDHDVLWEAGALVRLIDHPVDFVAGIYPHRKDELTFPVAWLDKPALIADPDTGLLEAEGAPMGFMRLRRAVLERMTQHHGTRSYPTERTQQGKAWALFDPYYTREGRRLSEDYSFCRRWRDLGGAVWIDPEIGMGHMGTKLFPGHLGKWLKERSDD